MNINPQNPCFFTVKEWTQLNYAPEYVDPELKYRQSICRSVRFDQQPTRHVADNYHTTISDMTYDKVLLPGCKAMSPSEINRLSNLPKPALFDSFVVRNTVDQLSFHYPMNSSCAISILDYTKKI